MPPGVLEPIITIAATSPHGIEMLGTNQSNLNFSIFDVFVLLLKNYISDFLLAARGPQAGAAVSNAISDL